MKGYQSLECISKLPSDHFVDEEDFVCKYTPKQGVKIGIISRQFRMAEQSIPTCSPSNSMLLSCKKYHFKSNIDRTMA